jgi:hypothetical protein
MIEPAQMHQLVNHDVVGHFAGHQHQTPVQADPPARGTRSPAGPLIANAHSRLPKPVLFRELVEARWKFPFGARPEDFYLLRRQLRFGPPVLLGTPPLAIDPAPLFVGELLGMTLRSPTGHRDAHAAVLPHSEDVPASPRVPDDDDLQFFLYPEVHRGLWYLGTDPE